MTLKVVPTCMCTSHISMHVGPTEIHINKKSTLGCEEQCLRLTTGLHTLEYVVYPHNAHRCRKRFKRTVLVIA